MGSFTDHSANERTFLAWLRTGIAVVAFGFVIEKFNLFLSAIGSANSELGKMTHLDRVWGAIGALRRLRHDGRGAHPDSSSAIFVLSATNASSTIRRIRRD